MDPREHTKILVDDGDAAQWAATLAAKGTADVADLDATEAEWIQGQLEKRNQWTRAIQAAGWKPAKGGGWDSPDGATTYADAADVARELARLGLLDLRLERMLRADVAREIETARRNGVAL